MCALTCLAKKIKLRFKSDIVQFWSTLLVKPLINTVGLYRYFLGSGYFASGGKIAQYYFVIWRQNSPYGYFAASAKIA